MNRKRVKIDGKFDRKAARRKFGCKRNSFKRSETWTHALQIRAGMLTINVHFKNRETCQ